MAISSQSGALGLAILDYARSSNLGISTFVSVGNKADVSGNDLIQYWAEDPRTDVILLYLESFGNPAVRADRPPRRAQEADRRGEGRPLHAPARAPRRSHTGALAERTRSSTRCFARPASIRTDTLEELFDVAMLLAQPAGAARPPRRRS